MRNEIDRYEENYQVKNYGKKIICSEKLGVLDALAFGGYVPKTANGRAAEYANKKLVVWSVAELFENQISHILTAAIIHAILSAATICRGRLALVTRKMRQYSARSDSLLTVRARG